jgi:hypothetical protein
VRTRTLLPWLLIPSLLVIGAACLLVVRVSSDAHDRTGDLARQSMRYELLLDAQSWVDNEIADLVALGAFATVPRDFDEAVGGGWELDGRDATIEDLWIVESLAGPVGRSLQTVQRPPIEVARGTGARPDGPAAPAAHRGRRHRLPGAG